MATDYTMLFRGVVPQINAAQSISEGMQLGQNIQKQRTQNALARLLGSAQNYNADGSMNFESMQAGAMQSPMAGYLMPSIIEQRQTAAKTEADRQKAVFDMLKTQSEIGKIGAETGKIGAETNNLGLTGKKTQTELDQDRIMRGQRVIGALAGNQALTKAQTLGALQNAWRTGAIDGMTFQSFASTIMPMDDAQAADFVRQQAIGTASPDKALSAVQPQAGNVNLGDTQQFYTTDPMTGAVTFGNMVNRGVSPDTLVTTNAANMRNQAAIDAANMRQDRSLQAAMQQAEASGYKIIQTSDGYQIVNPRQGGTATPVVDKSGQPVMPYRKPAETQQQRIERINNANAAAQSAAQAARAAQAAADLIVSKGIDEGTGITSVWGLVPSTDAKSFRTDLENLKSQLFLPMVQQMKGMGALSNAEGAKLEAAVQNLDPSIDALTLKTRLAEVAQQMAVIAELQKKEAITYAYAGNQPPQNQPQPQQQPQAGSYSRQDVLDVSREMGVSFNEAMQFIKSSGGSIK